MNKNKIVVKIIGPAGCGKSTVAQIISEELWKLGFKASVKTADGKFDLDSSMEDDFQDKRIASLKNDTEVEIIMVQTAKKARWTSR